MNDTPQNYPEIVYKYRTWVDPYHKDVLLKNELYLAPPKDFNDPFDLQIEYNYSLLDTPEKIEQYADKLTKKHANDLIAEGRDPNYFRQRMIYRLTNEMEKLQEENDSISIGMKNDHYGILSLSSRWDSILMWSHYADSHRGFCAGFYENELRTSRIFGMGGPVFCVDKYPILDPLADNDMNQAFKETHYKAKDWIYEGEYRLSNIFRPEPAKLSDRVKQIPDDFFAEVMLGLCIQPDAKKEIVGICNQKNIPVYELKKVPFEFKLARYIIK